MQDGNRRVPRSLYGVRSQAVTGKEEGRVIRRPKPTDRESDVTRAVILHMRSLGWREKRNHVGLFYTHNHTPIRIGVPGEPDWLFHRSSPPDLFWLEIKRPGKKPEKIQNEYIAKLRHMGYKAGWCDSIESLEQLLNEYARP